MKMPRDIVGGTLVVIVGIAFLVGSARLRIGTITNMGPGFFPLAAALVLIGLGAAIVIVGWRQRRDEIAVPWRGLLAISGGIGAFALMIGPLGLLPAVFTATSLTAVGDNESRLPSVLILSVCVCVAVWLIFAQLLGVRIPLVTGIL